MTDDEIAHRLRASREFTASIRSQFGYVEAREVRLQPIPNALVTARRIVSDTEVLGAVYDGERRLVASSQRRLEANPGDRTPIDPETASASDEAGAIRVAKAFYGGELYFTLGHFLFETAARLWPQVDFRQRVGDGEPTRFVFHPSLNFDLDVFLRKRLFRRSLAAFDIERAAIVMADRPVVADLLLYAEPLSIYHEYLHPLMGHVLDHLSRELAPERPRWRWPGHRESDRLYLSRSRWNVNVRVASEDVIEDAFRSRGFSVLHPQTMAPDDLLRRLREARFVAASDGSHAHLIAFCRPGTAALLLDTRIVSTQVALECLRRIDALHWPLMLEPGGGTVPIAVEPEALLLLLDAALAWRERGASLVAAEPA